jgi:hypothetical protein
VKQACLSKLILFGEAALRRALTEYTEHYHQERNHQGKGNLLLFPTSGERQSFGRAALRCRERLGGLLKFYGRVA